MRVIDHLTVEELALLNETLVMPEAVFLRVPPPPVLVEDVMEDVTFFVTFSMVVAGYALMLFLLCA